MDDFDLVDIGIPGLGGFAVAVANQIPAHLTFFTDTAHSRHISTPPTVRYFRQRLKPKRFKPYVTAI